MHHRAKSSSFVPAESAELGITDKILVKMNTQESVSKVRSECSCNPVKVSCIIQLTKTRPRAPS